MDLYHSRLYQEDTAYAASLDLPWEKLKGSSLLLSGATGLIGSFLVDVIMKKNTDDGLECTVYALTRFVEKARTRFSAHADDGRLRFLEYDVTKPFGGEQLGDIGYVLHLASNTHPLQYSTDPIGTIMTNIDGLRNLLEVAAEHHAVRFAFASSNEIYGENRGDTELFDEKYC